tara:strand:+ start:2208 stop:3086 length:879 start_codon:yes stop_codon:yes gene_type:complete
MIKKIKLLDGSLSYPIESRGHGLNSKLWTAKILIDNPKVIEDIHVEYINSGVDYISTSSYQLSVKTLKVEGYNISEIENIFKKSVSVAKKALLRTKKKNIKILGSFGPFATYLADGSEYTGVYNTKDETIKEFHLENLKIINKLDIDILLYETIPCLREISILNNLLKLSEKEVWISMTCNNAMKLRDNSSLKKACKILSQSKKISTIGLNCFDPSMTKIAIEKLRLYSNKKVLVYPNSGEKYNCENKTWLGKNKFNDQSISNWIEESPDIIGGCCRIGKEEIKQFKTSLEN